MGQKWSRNVAGECQEKTPTWAEVNIYYSKLLEIDQRYCKFLKDGLKAFLEFRMADMGKGEDVRSAVLDAGLICLTGSCGDGGGSCRWFKNNLADIEIDVMYEVGCVSPEEEQSIIQMIPEKPGFARVYNGPSAYNILHPILVRDRPELCKCFDTGKQEQVYVNTADMQEEVNKIWPHQDGDGEVARIAAALMEVKESELGFLLTEKTEGPSSMMELVVCLNEDPQVLYSNDNVLTLRIAKWPSCLDQWLRRESSKWQNEKQHMIDACFEQGCHLVAKRSPTDGMSNTEWRLSFSRMEQILMQSWNKHQKLCYYFIKSLYYRNLREICVDGKHIPSYALKTEMLWVVEETKTSEWTEDNIKVNALKVLKKLHEDLKAGNIPNYFLPVMNVADTNTYPKELLVKVAEEVKKIVDDLEEAIPKDLEKMIRLGNAILTVLNAVLAYIQFTIMKAGRKHAGGQMSNLQQALLGLNYGVDAMALFQGFTGGKFSEPDLD